MSGRKETSAVETLNGKLSKVQLSVGDLIKLLVGVITLVGLLVPLGNCGIDRVGKEIGDRIDAALLKHEAKGPHHGAATKLDLVESQQKAHEHATKAASKVATEVRKLKLEVARERVLNGERWRRQLGARAPKERRR